MKSLRKDVLIDYDQVENTKLEKEILLKVRAESITLSPGEASIPSLHGLRVPERPEDLLRDALRAGRRALQPPQQEASVRRGHGSVLRCAGSARDRLPARPEYNLPRLEAREYPDRQNRCVLCI